MDNRKLAEYFQDLDVVPSDFAAGLVLLRKYQKQQEHYALMKAIEQQQVLDSQVCFYNLFDNYAVQLLFLDLHFQNVCLYIL